MRSMTIAEAPPPPLQMPAAPIVLPVRMRLWSSVTMMRAPEQPIGWPSTTAPPADTVVNIWWCEDTYRRKRTHI